MISLRNIIAITILCSIFSLSTQAQNILVLEKIGTKKKTTFKSGDLIRFKLKEEKHFRQDHIVSVKDSSLVFHYNKFGIDEIAQIDISKKDFTTVDVKKIGTLLQVAGLGYIAIDNLNRYVIQGEEYVFDESVWITGGVLFVAGTGLKFLKPKKFKVGGRYRLRITNINFL